MSDPDHPRVVPVSTGPVRLTRSVREPPGVGQPIAA
jgi:hypothetical protein